MIIEKADVLKLIKAKRLVQDVYIKYCDDPDHRITNKLADFICGLDQIIYSDEVIKNV